MKDIIQIKNISFNYPDQERLFTNFSMNIHEGEWTAIIGQNGSGKSTLARLIDGLIVLKSGQIVVDGLTVNDENIFDIRNKIGMVFQNTEDQFVGATVEDDVAFGLENRQIPREKMQQIVENSLKQVGMWDFRDRIPANLSGGQKQRVAIAGIIALSPKIIILDEATSMLDPRGRQEILKLVDKIKHDNDLTVISITHDIDEAAGADQVIVVNKGKVVEADQPDKIFGDINKLTSIGLSAPFTSELLSALRKRGVDSPSQYLNDQRLITWIKQLISSK
ncbi:energy-coupling factor transporter ATPase [Lentilactobacillus parakefiri]|uniref:Energy-coupling factor transporter ATPase n=1 Tax=Lentilactobacillus parakefiri TaxID=152332 RepID=A0A269YMF2_9LACO|nr:energy-coupling factor transporter ATPase [Lentilactobacillus parakefiri]PAK86747.1 energy-coupling factor transporter ATPase [Lentilactobacillus parakefiri]